MPAKMSVKDIDVGGKRVLVRADFNVPLDEHGRISSDMRIRATLPTIKYLLEQDTKLILCSHLGRPRGKIDEKLSLAPIGRRLAELLGRPVQMAPECIGPAVEVIASGLQNGQILMLENLRFHPEEEANINAFARALAGLAEVYVNDAFGASHRAHASIVGVPHFLPAAAGLLMEKEIGTLGGLLQDPVHPFKGLFGGAKVSDKTPALRNIMPRLDALLIGGAMAALFLKAHSFQIGQSKVEMDRLDEARDLVEDAARRNTELLLPVDVLVTDRLDGTGAVKVVPVQNIPPNLQIVDIGPQTIASYRQQLMDCRTLIWNGPVGIYEVPRFAQGTRELATYISELDLTSVIAGGSTADVVEDLKLADKMTFVSTGGGASLVFLAGESLPGLEALPDRNPSGVRAGRAA